MWRNLSKRSYLINFKILSESRPSLKPVCGVISPQDSVFLANSISLVSNIWNRELGVSQELIFWRKPELGFPKVAISSKMFRFCRNARGYGSAAEALASTSEEDVDEVQELIEEMNKEIDVKGSQQKHQKMMGGMGLGRYNALRRRQIKMETEAWEEAAKEYQELLVDMCEQKLAPNLPYIKSLFLGWFEPLRDAIAAEQDLCKNGKNRGAYAPYFDHLPAGMMAVITMHKLMALLMTGGENGSARVVQAACHIGEAIEHKARIHWFLESSKRKNALNRISGEEPDNALNEQVKLRKKVTMLMKKQRLQQVRKIVKQQDEFKPWGEDNHVKVGCRLIQILMETAYIQPPVDQFEDGPPDIRPAFVHTLRSVETLKGLRRYGVIECDPLVRKGLEKTARHMVIPYMPMLVSPLNWTGHNIFFKSEVLKLSPSEIDAIVQKFSFQNSENAIGFFFFLQNELGIKHSRSSCFVVAHLLAEKKRLRGLHCHLLRVVQDEGSESATPLCELLFKSFRCWDSNNLVWDILALVYSRSGMVHDSLVVVARMKNLDIQPSIMTYHSLLHNLRHTDMIWDVYDEIKASGSGPTEYTNSIFLDGLCRQCLIHEAIAFLCNLEGKEGEPCLASYNTLMSGFCRLGFVDIAKSLFCKMCKNGLLPDAYSYNILIHGLCVAGSVEEALDFTNDMENHGLEPDQVTYNIIAKGFHLLGMMDGDWKVTKKMLRLESKPDFLTNTILLCWHCQTGNVEAGLKLREEMISKGFQLNRISYCVLLSCLCKSGRIDEALALLYEIASLGVKPDTFMYSAIIHGLCKLGEVKRAVQLFNNMCTEEIASNGFLHRSILLGLCKKGLIFEARSYFDTLTNRELMQDIVLYNIMVDTYANLGNVGEAVLLYQKLLERGIEPSIVTFNSLLNGFCKIGKLVDARQFLNSIKLHDLVPNVITYTTIMNAFCDVGNIEAAFKLLEEMAANDVEPNQVTYSVVMKGLCRQGKVEDAVKVFKGMFAKGLSPDQASYNVLIQYLFKAREFERAFHLHDEMIMNGIQPNHITYNIIINGLCVYGNLCDAERVFSSLQDQNFRVSKVAYTTLIKANCAKGDARKAMLLFHQMAENGFEISVRDYSAVINRLCKRSLVKNAMEFVRMMLVGGLGLDQQICSVMIHSFDQIGDFASVFQFYALTIKCGFYLS